LASNIKHWEELCQLVIDKRLRVVIIEGTACIGKTTFLTAASQPDRSAAVSCLDYFEAINGIITDQLLSKLQEKVFDKEARQAYSYHLEQAFSNNMEKMIREAREDQELIFDRCHLSNILYDRGIKSYLNKANVDNLVQYANMMDDDIANYFQDKIRKQLAFKSCYLVYFLLERLPKNSKMVIGLEMYPERNLERMKKRGNFMDQAILQSFGGNDYVRLQNGLFIAACNVLAMPNVRSYYICDPNHWNTIV
jgi:thymidylate kinase